MTAKKYNKKHRVLDLDARDAINGISAGAGPRALGTQQQLAQLDTSPLRAPQDRNGAGADPWTP